MAARRVNLRAQAAALELRLDPVRVPRRYAERNVIDADAAPPRRLAELRIQRVAATDDDVADSPIISSFWLPSS